MLIKEYFKNVTNNKQPDINMIDTTESLQADEKLKVVEIDDNTTITFYKSGMFSIGRVEVEKLDAPIETNAIEPNSLPWTTVSRTYTDKAYNGLGVWYATVRVSCTYRYLVRVQLGEHFLFCHSLLFGVLFHQEFLYNSI